MIHTKSIDGNITLPEDLQHVHPENIFEWNYTHFKAEGTGAKSGAIVDDSTSPIGKAIKLDSTTRDYSDSTLKITEKALPIMVSYRPTGGSNTSPAIFSITAAQMLENTDGGYHLYEFNGIEVLTDNVAVDRFNYLSLFAYNDIRSAQVTKDLNAAGLQGKKLDVYVSLRYTGDISTTSSAYYFDRIIMVNTGE